MKIGFCVLQFGLRATEKTTFSYARYCEELLGHESIIIGNKVREMDSYEKFNKRFKIILTEKDVSIYNNDEFRRQMEKIVDDEKLDYLYWQIDGRNYNYCVNNCKNLVHYVFDGSDKHGHRYSAISEYLAKKHNKSSFVPYCIDLPKPTKNIREELNIPKDTILFSRTGGRDSFHNIGSAKRVVYDIVNNNRDIYFVFLNTDKFYEHPQIRYINGTTDEQFISNLIYSSDAMLHCRNGETFGLAIGEYSYFNKPVITYSGTQDDYAHLQILGDQAIKYHDYNSLYGILAFWGDIERKGPYDAYKQFAPKNVMDKFNEEFLI